MVKKQGEVHELQEPRNTKTLRGHLTSLLGVQKVIASLKRRDRKRKRKGEREADEGEKGSVCVCACVLTTMRV